MAGEIQVGPYPTGQRLYVVLRNDAGQLWSFVAGGFVAQVNANWRHYVLPIAEDPVGGSWYVGHFPTAITTLGEYGVQPYVCVAGGDPLTNAALTDAALRAGTLYWSGTAELSEAEWSAHVTRGELETTIPEFQRMKKGMIGFYEGDTLAKPLEELGDLTGWTKLWFTVKRLTDTQDTTAVIQIEEIADPPSSALLYLNGAAATAGQGSIEVTNPAGGEATIHLSEVATAQLFPDKYLYDVVVLTPTGRRTCGQGVLHVWPSITKAVA